MDFLKMFKQLSEIKSKMGEVEKTLGSKRLEIKNNGIYIMVNAKKDVIDIKIDQELYDQGKDDLEKKLLETLKQSLSKSQDTLMQEIKSQMGGLDLGMIQNMMKS